MKKVWVWLKTYWWAPLLVVAAVVSLILLFGKKNGKIGDMFEDLREKYDKEIDIIEVNSAAEKEEQQKNKERYERALFEIEKQISLKRDEISKNQKKKVVELVKKHGDDYDSMVQEMADEFGFEVV